MSGEGEFWGEKVYGTRALNDWMKIAETESERKVIH